jgi:hypothetical protein
MRCKYLEFLEWAWCRQASKRDICLSSDRTDWSVKSWNRNFLHTSREKFHQRCHTYHTVENRLASFCLPDENDCLEFGTGLIGPGILKYLIGILARDNRLFATRAASAFPFSLSG